MKYLINYADGCCREARFHNSVSGLQQGFDSVIQWNRTDLDDSFLEETKDIINQNRGAGYWIWKPYVIRKTLEMVNQNDIVFYSDAAAVFIRDMNPIFDAIIQNDIIGFELAGHHKEGVWTRKSCIQKIGLDPETTRHTDQRMASFIGIKNCERSRNIIDEYLSFCKIPDMVLDLEEDSPLEEFKEHRHDQSVWSLITKKHDVEIIPDPTQWGIKHQQSTENDFYINHHRNKV